MDAPEPLEYIKQHYLIHNHRHALTILERDFPVEWGDILSVLLDFRLMHSEVVAAGGRKSKIADRLDGPLTARGWVEKRFDTKVMLDGVPRDNPTHGIDCYKNRVALEVEWNNKDPFFDRDLNNFRILFELDAVDVGVVITRSSELQLLFNRLNKGDSYGQSTTHWNRLIPRIKGGGAGGCPVLAFGITEALYTVDILEAEVLNRLPPDQVPNDDQDD